MEKRAPIFFAAFITLVLFGSGCETAERDATTEPAVTPAPTVSPEPSPSPTGAPEWLADGATHTVAAITGAPKAVIGKTVTVVAEVEEVYDPRAFELGGDSSRRNLLALIPRVGDFPKVDDQWKNKLARVTGVVQWMSPEIVEREIGWVLPRSLEARFKGKPALIARSVELLDR
jgi:hypothetical protein